MRPALPAAMVSDVSRNPLPGRSAAMTTTCGSTGDEGLREPGRHDQGRPGELRPGVRPDARPVRYAAMISGHLGWGTRLDDSVAAYAASYAAHVVRGHQTLARAVQVGQITATVGT